MSRAQESGRPRLANHRWPPDILSQNTPLRIGHPWVAVTFTRPTTTAGRSGRRSTMIQRRTRSALFAVALSCAALTGQAQDPATTPAAPDAREMQQQIDALQR